jgi:hypothetical protein
MKALSRLGLHANLAIVSLALTACVGPETGRYGGLPFETLSSRHRTLTALVVPRTPRRFGNVPWLVGRTARSKTLLYVTDELISYDFVFNYPQRTFFAYLQGFNRPQGECSGGKAVWITDTGNSRIVKYEGKKQVGIIEDYDEGPVGCSYDKTTGNLAVTDIQSASGEGTLQVFAHAKGAAKTYNCPDITSYFFVGYDSSGDIFVDGQSAGGTFGFCELPSGESNLEDISLNQSIKFPGGVQWDGKYIAVGDQDADAIYQFTISGSLGTKEGTTALLGQPDCVQFWIYKGTVICPDANNESVDFYPYPGGGKIRKIITGFYLPIGVTISS